MTWPWMMVVLALVVVVVGQSILLLGLMTRLEPTLAKLETLFGPGTELYPATGKQLPETELYDGSGGSVRSGQWLGTQQVLLFAAASCPPCMHLLDGLRASPAREPDVPVMLITNEASAQVLRDATLPDWLIILHEYEDGLAEGLGVDRTPLAVLVDEHNRVQHTTVPKTVDDILSAPRITAERILSGP
ncbi:hypothetical protein F5X71_08305 [Nocardia brasiliensis]|uniref:Redoxin domain-containing protein n=1 Tax=Nocardia brasiliensis TaxID=37326 RepID=A0A6G9XMZ7_NOCBR|nr:hypothetical protein [Nocardia brasiliensis]QIS02322.1 hypothetical protein F5X71_08305 [Nocardia brasiliensis]